MSVESLNEEGGASVYEVGARFDPFTTLVGTAVELARGAGGDTREGPNGPNKYYNPPRFDGAEVTGDQGTAQPM